MPLAVEPEDVPEDAQLFTEPAQRIPVPAPGADDASGEESEECKAPEETDEVEQMWIDELKEPVAKVEPTSEVVEEVAAEDVANEVEEEVASEDEAQKVEQRLERQLVREIKYAEAREVLRSVSERPQDLIEKGLFADPVEGEEAPVVLEVDDDTIQPVVPMEASAEKEFYTADKSGEDTDTKRSILDRDNSFRK